MAASPKVVRKALPDQTDVRVMTPPDTIDGVVRRAVPARQPVRPPTSRGNVRRAVPRS
jgi:hypothetical protein